MVLCPPLCRSPDFHRPTYLFLVNLFPDCVDKVWKPLLTRSVPATAAEGGGNNLKHLKEFHLKARTRFWYWLSEVCRVCSKAVPEMNPRVPEELLPLRERG